MNVRSDAAGPLTIVGAAVLLVLGLVVGFQLLTASADTGAVTPTCESRVVGADDKVTSSLVQVDVFNASSRAGLANRVSINLQRRGFRAGQIGNTESKVDPRVAAILTKDPDDPRVRLVAAQLGTNAQILEPDVPVSDDAVTVVIGDGFRDLAPDATRAIDNNRRFTVCLPSVPTA